MRRDLVIAALISALGMLLMALSVGDRPKPGEGATVHVGSLLPAWLAVPLIVAVTAPVAWRRVDGLVASGALVAGLALNIALLGTDWLRCGLVFIVAATIVFNTPSLPVLATCLAALVADLLLEFAVVHAVVGVALTAAVWQLGRLAQRRRHTARQLAARTEELHLQRDANARAAVGAERARLAAELDALLKRRLGELAALTDGASNDRLAAIERESRATLAEMRRLVGLLRGGEASPPAVSAFESALTVDSSLRIDGEPRMLPPVVELAALRALGYLSDATDALDVQVTFADHKLELTIAGRASAGIRAALAAARERVGQHHGSLESTDHDGGFTARVVLPLGAV